MPDPAATDTTKPQPPLATVLVDRVARDVVVLQVSGELDTTSAVELVRPLETHLVDANRAVIVDLGGVRFLGSAGLEALVVGQQRAKEHDVEFLLVAGSRAALRPIQATGLDAVFTIVGSTSEAVERFV
ncbi:STAS domain-containing protein [Umezawaea beigongshangensis]|uniref:STAS domain-containing protein n=1 Tax=Umezawaea beigongshangensis TaxID=2780383 RepID=UPI0018F19DCE|nr:STAS domain-containing protein [Umezawaea beigongshangensis]